MSDGRPTQEQIDAVIERVEWLQSMSYLREEGRVPEPASDTVLPWWEDLTRDEQQSVLATDVDWEGFTESQKDDVINRVLEEEGSEYWMDGIVAVDQAERTASDLRSMRDEEASIRLLEKGVDYGEGPYGVDPPAGTFDAHGATARELFDTANRVMFANYLDEHALDPGVALRAAEQVREIWFREAEKTWESFREECQFRTHAEIVETLAEFKAMEAGLGETRTLMDHLRAGGLFVEPDLNPYSAAESSAGGAFRHEGFECQVSEKEQGLPIRPLTRELIACCQLDVWPGNATVVDFGIDTSSHLGALQFAIREGLVTPGELDAAMGDGAKLTGIAQRGDNPYRDVKFETSWDRMGPEPEDAPSSPMASASVAEAIATPVRFQEPSDYQRAIDQAADSAAHHQPDKGKGPER